MTDLAPQAYEADIDMIGQLASVPQILEVICRTTGMGFSAVARVTEDRWIACAVRDEIAFGLKPGGELKLETTICHEIRQSGEGVVIDQVSRSPTFRDHHTPKMYGFESYISLPIVLADGSFFGTLCAIDPRPAQIETPQVIGMFKLFSQLIAAQIDGHARQEEQERTARLREEFMAVLSHDLRNPLAAFDAGLRQIQKTPLDAKAQTYVSLMQQSSARMLGLVRDVLDLARGRLGGGFSVNRTEILPGEVIARIVDEARAKWPARNLHTDYAFTAPVFADAGRLGQAASNLIENAMSHGARDGVVGVAGRSDDKGFELSVTNQGAPIAADAMARLFMPFERAAGRTGEGLGLGLYIASETAKAHGGTLTATSDARETKFTLRIPR